jgi:hypothetical protein
LTAEQLPAPSLNSGFPAFWNSYPRRVGKQAALRAWKTHHPPLDACLKAIAWQKDSDQWGQGFIPNPATWINQHRWEDERPADVEPEQPTPRRPVDDLPTMDSHGRPITKEEALAAIKRSRD